MNKQTIKAPAVLTPAAVAAINEAYAEACRIAKATDRDNQLRFRLADRIVFLARYGELDPRRLSAEAVAALMGEPKTQHFEAKTAQAAAPHGLAVGEFGRLP